MVASGTYGYGEEAKSLTDINELGAIITKSVTRHPREGNPPPRIAEERYGMLNSIGLPNPGIQALLNGDALSWPSLKVPIIASIAGYSTTDFRDLASAFEDIPGVVAIEANFSCPNIEHGLEFATDTTLLTEAIQAIREVSSIPLLAKLSPNVGGCNICPTSERGGSNRVSGHFNRIRPVSKR